MLRHSTEAQTPEESARISRMLALGCICCIESRYTGGREKIEVHHIVETKRLGHWYTLPLCVGHHQGRWSNRQIRLLPPERRVAISDGGKAFVAAFASERVLWEILQGVLGLSAEWVPTKILPRRIA